MAILTYRYRLYPPPAQETRLRGWLESLRLLYNFALAERRDAYKAEQRSVSAHEQHRTLPDLKERFSRYAEIHSQVLQDAIFRLDRAFNRFFSGGGYPRFKVEGRYRSLTYPQATAFRILPGGKAIRLSGIGNVPVRYHRPHEGTSKAASVVRYPSGKWWLCIPCEVPDVPIQDGPLTGFDLGLENYLTSSDGAVTKPARSLKSAQKKLGREQRRLSRKQTGSNNRRKQRTRVARAHERVVNRRRDFLHKTSRRLVDSHDGFAFEKLSVRNMLKNQRLARSISDASWSVFVSMTAYKAEKAGKPFVLVPPHGTSSRCSGCDALVPKTLKIRTHVCPECKMVLDRDQNAAINIERRAGVARSYACREAATTGEESHPHVASSKQEALPFTAG